MKALALLLQIQHLFRGLDMPITLPCMFTHSLPLHPATPGGRDAPTLCEGRRGWLAQDHRVKEVELELVALLPQVQLHGSLC